MHRLFSILFVAVLLVQSTAAFCQDNGDEKTFSSADWNWRPLKGGAQVGYAQLPLFDSMQSISVIRYPLRKVKTFIANDLLTF